MIVEKMKNTDINPGDYLFFGRTTTEMMNMSKSLKMEETLRETQERYRALFERSLDCVYLHDLEGNFIDANPAALHLLGYKKEELATLNFKSLLSKDQIPKACKVLKEIIETGYQDGLTEFKLRCKNGEYVFVETTASMIYRNGRPYAIQGIARDITERKRTEEALRKAYTELKETQQELIQAEKLAALGRFASGFAHEIRNPLSCIVAAAQVCLSNHTDTTLLRKYLKIILDNAENANKILKDILDFARPRDLTLEMGDIGEVIASALELVKGRCARQGIRITRRINRNLPPLLLNKKSLQETFLNFILNACDAMPEGGNLNITSYFDPHSEEVIVRFKDSGYGISQENLNKIFEPFFTTKDDGVGLGLYLAHQIISYHNGRLHIKSKPGEGTEVTVRFPVLKQPFSKVSSSEDTESVASVCR
ncbi:PAS domain S-box protein [Candidatus Sumerlaeota bacterium]|nr:PAS domain S-box protein [Candidatus Sumerlaeota bacterium]